MAAPSGAYRTKSIFARNLANTADIEHLIAILQTNKATMLARFYLDGLLSSTLAEGDGVIGYCRIGSANYNMHNSARIGNLRVYDAGDCVVFNDAGLNTLAFANLNNVLKWAANRIKISASFLSAFYDISSEKGYQYRILGQTTWTSYSTSESIPLPAGQGISVTEIMNTGLPKDTEVHIRAYIVNPEGTMYSNLFYGMTTDRVENVGAIKRLTACATTGIVMEIWMKETDINNMDTHITMVPSASGIFAYKDEDMTLPIDSGFYANVLSDFKVVNVGDGQFLNYIQCSPPVTPKDLSIYVLVIEQPDGSVDYGVQVAINTGVKAFAVTVVGNLQGLSGTVPIGGSSGSGNFNVTIPIGQGSKTQLLTFKPNATATSVRANITSVTPSTLTYETIAG